MKSFYKHIHLLIASILLLVLNCKAEQSADPVESAKAAYSKGDYVKAIQIYEDILNNGQEAGEIYFNLGNAYYKSNMIGLSILNYERARKLMPEDDDVNANLKMANARIEDKIDSAPQLFLTEWKNGIVYLMNEKSWSILCIIITMAALLLLVVYFTSPGNGWKRFGFFGGCTLIITSVIVFFIAQHSYNLSRNSTEAVIISPSVTVLSSPDEKSTKLFLLHEGSKVSISQETEDWMEIKIANGNVGWVKKQDIISI